jgi:hypothetical protein
MQELCAGLKEAYGQFLNADDGSRAGVITALGWVIGFLNKFEPVAEGRFATPLLVLASALGALDRNNVQPLLAPTLLSNRAPAGTFRVTVKAVSVYTAEVLNGLGVKKQEAYKSVASVLNKNGIELRGLEKAISGRTGRGWKDKIAADVAREKELSRFFWGLKNSEMTELLLRKPEKASAKVILMLLGFFVSQYRAEDAR